MNLYSPFYASACDEVYQSFIFNYSIGTLKPVVQQHTTVNQTDKKKRKGSSKLIQLGDKQIKISHTESKILNLLLQGLAAKQIAATLALSKRTVECYLNQMRRKAGCHSSLALLSKIKFHSLKI